MCLYFFLGFCWRLIKREFSRIMVASVVRVLAVENNENHCVLLMAEDARKFYKDVFKDY